VAFERLVKRLQGRVDINEAMIEQGTADFNTFTDVMETSLDQKDYVTGRISLGDFALAPFFNIGMAVGLSLDAYPRVKRWLVRMNERESIRRARADADAPTR
jgi:glutathione S-transferase